MTQRNSRFGVAGWCSLGRGTRDMLRVVCWLDNLDLRREPCVRSLNQELLNRRFDLAICGGGISTASEGILS